MLARALGAIERAGDRLPGPLGLFAVAWGLVLVASVVAARRGVSGTHPGTGANIAAVDLLSHGGLGRLLRDAPRSFTALPQVGAVLVVLLGVGVAERSGLLGAVLARLGRTARPRALTAGLVLAGILSSAFGDIGLVALPVLGACLFAAHRRHPLAGAAAAFAGVTGGFGANLLLGAVDPLLAASTEAAARAADPARSVGVAANYWFAFASGLLLTAVATAVNHRWVEPRLGPWAPPENPSMPVAGPPGGTESPSGAGGPSGEGGGAADGTAGEERSAAERAALAGRGADDPRALRLAGVALLAVGVVFALLAVPAAGPLRDGNGTLRPFFDALPVIVLAAFLVPAVVHGHAARTLRGPRALVRAAADSLAALGPYLLLALVAAQLFSALETSNLGVLAIVEGARLLHRAHLSGAPLLVATVAAAACANLLVPGASAKWAILAPVVVPLAMASGHTPEAAQAAFRVGDSSTNMMTPLLVFYPLFVAVVQRYAPRARSGTLAVLTLPYSVFFLLAWTALLIAWILAGLPFGPGAPV